MATSGDLNLATSGDFPMATDKLCVIRLDQHDTRGALKAAARGLLADPASELLYGHVIRAAALEGQTDVVDRLVGRLRAQTEAIDPDAGLSDEIIELLSTLSST